ncbi:CDP-glycerol glycerophosphotransferase family protein [uncultured Treponema sp.]|uniref:CDP-glycerol glycerophosphotransferase family protein n=1 Tax=uncultured Treponema sp. TaxID=162155 RepID=UPI0025EFE6BF|nr:CDP-glycerol glycerophosphotransferase family protein [uncultured Treponema sp.]
MKVTTDIFFRKAARKIIRLTGYVIYKFSPVNERLIVFQSEGDFWDNAYALFDYMVSNGYNKKYRLVWLVNDACLYKDFAYENIEFVDVNSFSIKSNLRLQKIKSTAKYFFFTHWGYKYRKKGQFVINLWHGSIVMKASSIVSPTLYKSFDFQCSPSMAAAERMSLFTGMRKEQTLINGDCRQDYLFSDCEEKVKSFLGKGYDKYILGMPTFKKAKNWTDAQTESWILPIVKNKEQFEILNNFCKNENVLLVLKVHHLEDTSFINAGSLTNIRVLKDEDLQKARIQVYELIGKTDALLTDFSSVAYDYMLLDRPIGYMVSEMQNYTRGFIIPNIEDEMAGEKLTSLEDLEQFILDVKNGKDEFRAARKSLVDKFFIYQKDGNCERLLEKLGIEKC